MKGDKNGIPEERFTTSNFLEQSSGKEKTNK